MRHRSRTNNLSRKPEHAKAMTRNLLVSLIEYGRIKTTHQKAKRLQRVAEKVVTLAKRDTNAAMKKISAHIPFKRKTAISKLINEIAPRFKNRTGGYTRVLKTGFRRGDNAEMAIIEYLENDVSPAKRSAAKPEKTEESMMEETKMEETAAEEIHETTEQEASNKDEPEKEEEAEKKEVVSESSEDESEKEISSKPESENNDK